MPGYSMKPEYHYPLPCSCGHDAQTWHQGNWKPTPISRVLLPSAESMEKEASSTLRSLLIPCPVYMDPQNT